jgi:hypothetical protein
MNLAEARILAINILAKNCGSRPLAVYDGSTNSKPFGDSKTKPGLNDPGVVICKLTTKKCIFCAGDYCPKGFKSE